jgi:S1-C subfamily serine protease
MSRKRLLLTSTVSVLLVLMLAVFPAFAQSVVENTNFTQIYNRVTPSVVSIVVVKNADSAGPVINPQQQQEQVAGGTGFVIDTAGHIVTNYHVVRDAEEIQVEFFDGTLAHAEIIGLDDDSDLAVIQVSNVPVERLQPVTFGDSSALQVGEQVLAIGSPFGERWTLTTGIVSAVNRTLRGFTEFSIGGVIQTDAAINPGNSGGPLVNMQGQVIGVNSQIVSGTGSNAGIGFAIPSNLTQNVAQNLIETGFMEYSYLGVGGGNVALSLMDAFNLPNNTRGVVITTVVPGSPADRAGIEPMGQLIQNDSGDEIPQSVDIITAINGTPITGIDSLIGYLAQQTQPGDAVTLTVLRDGQETIELTTTLTPRP